MPRDIDLTGLAAQDPDAYFKATRGSRAQGFIGMIAAVALSITIILAMAFILGLVAGFVVHLFLLGWEVAP